MKHDLSIIIPTHKRTDTLRLCLECIEHQTIDDFEVIVISDGPDEKTDEMMANMDWDFPFQYFAIPKSQQGVCRNRAVEKAKGKYSLLIGDDIFLAPDACEKHLNAHRNIQDTKYQIPNTKYESAVLGHTTWDPSLHITPLMKWMEESGVQFGYPKIMQYAHDFIPEHDQHRFTYTSHLSLPSKILYQNQFREDVSLYGWEDIEWGKRLAEEDVKLFYEPEAQAFHHHQFKDSEVWERSRLLGLSAAKMEKLVPDMHFTPQGFKKIAYQALSFLPTYRGKHYKAFLRGMRDSLNS